MVGQNVRVPGVVTAVAANGFYLQDPNPDANAATSEGIFVFTSTRPTVVIGNQLSVAGKVSEFRPGGDRQQPHDHRAHLAGDRQDRGQRAGTGSDPARPGRPDPADPGTRGRSG